MDRVRSFKSDSNKLDDNLVSLQEQGHAITQILPCPESVRVEERGKSVDGAIGMKFIIIFVEKEDAGEWEAQK